MLMVLTRKYARLSVSARARAVLAAAATVCMRLVHLIKQIKRTVCIRHVRITFDVVICVYLCNLTLHAAKSTLYVDETRRHDSHKRSREELNVTIVHHNSSHIKIDEKFGIRRESV